MVSNKYLQPYAVVTCTLLIDQLAIGPQLWVGYQTTNSKQIKTTKRRLKKMPKSFHDVQFHWKHLMIDSDQHYLSTTIQPFCVVWSRSLLMFSECRCLFVHWQHVHHYLLTITHLSARTLIRFSSYFEGAAVIREVSARATAQRPTRSVHTAEPNGNAKENTWCKSDTNIYFIGLHLQHRQLTRDIVPFNQSPSTWLQNNTSARIKNV